MYEKKLINNRTLIVLTTWHTCLLDFIRSTVLLIEYWTCTSIIRCLHPLPPTFPPITNAVLCIFLTNTTFYLDLCMYASTHQYWKVEGLWLFYRMYRESWVEFSERISMSKSHNCLWCTTAACIYAVCRCSLWDIEEQIRRYGRLATPSLVTIIYMQPWGLGCIAVNFFHSFKMEKVSVVHHA